MKFDLTRQTFVPAFLTLAALAATAVYAFRTGEAPAAVPFAAPVGDMLWMPGELLLRFQSAFPKWAQALTCLLIVATGTRTGYLPVRYSLYTVNTYLAVPFFGIIACGLGVGHIDLYTFVCAFLLILSIRNFCRAYSPNFAFDPIFRGALYLGMLVVLCPKTCPLLLLLPLALVQFHRTLRELIIAVAGLLLPVLTLCYVNWGAGHSFLAPIFVMVRELPQGEFMRLFFDMPFQAQCLGGAILFCVLCALFSFRSQLYVTGVKAQRIVAFHLEAFLLTLAIAVLPDAPTLVFALAAIPAAILLPWFFVENHPIVAQPAYLLLLAGAFANMYLQ